MNAILYNLGYTTVLNSCLHVYIPQHWTIRESIKNYFFMGLVYLPTSVAWIKMTNTLKSKIFTEFTEYQLKNFQFMYFASREALIFDVFANHILY